MLYARFGRGIAEKFLIPYNEKLYATTWPTLDRDAMGRFFPHADLDRHRPQHAGADNASYNATFTYPAGGAIEYVNALASACARAVRDRAGRGAVGIDLRRPRGPHHEARDPLRAPRLLGALPEAAAPVRRAHDAAAIYTWNKVLVFNLGFDRKGPRDVHWVYFPTSATSFYRVGFYDNIFDTDR
jgi:protoporphyrinogen oxidase